MSNIISTEVFDLFDTIARNKSALLAAATSQSQRDVIENAYLLAQALAEKFATRIFDANDAKVKGISAQIKGVTTQLNNNLTNLQNIVATIDQLTSTVNTTAGLLSGLP